MKGRVVWDDGAGTVVRTQSIPAPFEKGTAFIEDVLNDVYADALYRSEVVAEWMRENQLEPVDFGGHVIAYPVTFLCNIPESVLTRLRWYDSHGKRRRVTKKIAAEILSVLKEAAAQEPSPW